MRSLIEEDNLIFQLLSGNSIFVDLPELKEDSGAVPKTRSEVFECGHIRIRVIRQKSATDKDLNHCGQSASTREAVAHEAKHAMRVRIVSEGAVG